ncbi:unnamed protein product [Closterium sp. Naga37s-1]|nr:unnamed protein product [Closterium sp. Naga37s-1]
MRCVYLNVGTHGRYFSPYPPHLTDTGRLFICNTCLKYSSTPAAYERHLEKCQQVVPPGEEVYRARLLPPGPAAPTAALPAHACEVGEGIQECKPMAGREGGRGRDGRVEGSEACGGVVAAAGEAVAGGIARVDGNLAASAAAAAVATAAAAAAAAGYAADVGVGKGGGGRGGGGGGRREGSETGTAATGTETAAAAEAFAGLQFRVPGGGVGAGDDGTSGSDAAAAPAATGSDAKDADLERAPADVAGMGNSVSARDCLSLLGMLFLVLKPRCLSLLGKLFLEHKPRVYTVEGHTFYVLTRGSDTWHTLIGYFAIECPPAASPPPKHDSPAAGTEATNSHRLVAEAGRLVTEAEAAPKAPEKPCDPEATPQVPQEPGDSRRMEDGGTGTATNPRGDSGGGGSALPLEVPRRSLLPSPSPSPAPPPSLLTEVHLSSVVVLPPYQRRGFGRWLLSVAYEMAASRQQLLVPKPPLSDLGSVAFRSYWRWQLLLSLKKLQGSCSINSLSKSTAIQPEDIRTALKQLKLAKYCDLSGNISVPPNVLSKKTKLACG